MKRFLSTATRVLGAALIVVFGAAVGDLLLFPDPLEGLPAQECCANSKCGHVYEEQAYCAETFDDTNCILLGGDLCEEEACTGPPCQT
jgi:hypothetical protein